MKVRCETEQQSVNWYLLDDNMVDVAIYLNGQEVTETYVDMDGNSNERTIIEYDHCIFRESLDYISKDDVVANPENYLDYKPVVEKTTKEKLDELLTQAKITSNVKDLITKLTERVKTLESYVDSQTGKTVLQGKGSADDPYTLTNGITLIQNAYYTYNNVRYVYMGEADKIYSGEDVTEDNGFVEF